VETVQSIEKYDKKFPTVITIGTFDGVHIGHKTILKRLIKSAKKQDLKATVLTFFPHPRMVLQKDADIKLLNTISEKGQILKQLGIDNLIIHPFTKDFSRLSAIEFVRDMLVNELKTKKIIIGYDHRFGRNRTADITDLRSFGNTFDFEVEEISAQEIDAVSVSSTKIRKALTEGNIAKANRFLGYDYMLTGNVVRGKGLGRKLNFPTANIHIESSTKLIPANGVYVVYASIDGEKIYGMMNIGQNPTVSGKNLNIEVHFFHFNQDLYDRTIQVHLIARLRDEHQFGSVEALQAQLEEDKLAALAIISK